MPESIEAAWLREQWRTNGALLAEYDGRWIAVRGTEIVGANERLADLIREVEGPPPPSGGPEGRGPRTSPGPAGGPVVATPVLTRPRRAVRGRGWEVAQTPALVHQFGGMESDDVFDFTYGWLVDRAPREETPRRGGDRTPGRPLYAFVSTRARA